MYRKHQKVPARDAARATRGLPALSMLAASLLFTAIGVTGVGVLFPPQIAQLAHLDFSLVALTLLVAIIATVLAAFYPAWRAASVQPAWQLKSN